MNASDYESGNHHKLGFLISEPNASTLKIKNPNTCNTLYEPYKLELLITAIQYINLTN